MDDLTDKWKAGELPYDDDNHVWLSYYIKHKDGLIHEDSYWRGQWGISDRDAIAEVLDKVPTYEEVQDMKEYLDYSIKNRQQLTTQINIWIDKAYEANKKNIHLKELLQECMDMFVKMYSTNTVNSAFLGLYDNIKTKIEEALK